MDDVQHNLHIAWKHIRPELLRDPHELARRVARLSTALFAHPPRAWCIALRASDMRLNRFAKSRQCHDASEQRLALTGREIARLIAPVYLPRGGLRLAEIARRLGTTPQGLLDARISGVFTTRHVAGLGGAGGKPRPLLSCDRPLDPCARSFALADPIWSATAPHHPGRIPRGLRVTLTRVEHFHSLTPDFDRDTTDLHPEHPLRDPPPPAHRSKRLPPPQKDFVWYKWKGDDFVGYDWRADNPQITGHHFKHHRELEKIRERQRRHRAQNPPPSRAAGSEQFRGYRWLCPRCGRKVNLLFLPLPRVHLLGRLPLPSWERAGVRGKRESKNAADCEQTFACEKCHKIRRVSRCDPNAWNEIVTYLSAGLLYGREVERPSWFAKSRRVGRPMPKTRGRAAALPDGLSREVDGPDETLLPNPTTGRKIAYTPRPTRAPSARRPQIERMLLAGMSFKSIAAQLGLAKGTILWHAQQVYKHHHVRTLVELLNKFGKPTMPSKKEQVRLRIEAGESVAHIATEMGISGTCIYNHIYMLRRAGKLPKKRAKGATIRTAETPGASHTALIS